MGTPEETFFLDWCARNAAGSFKAWNGGVHRGGIPGESWHSFPIVPDQEFMRSDDGTDNVIAYGTPKTNALLARWAESLPLRFGNDEIRLADRVYRGQGVAVIAVLPYPENAERYLAVHGGVTPDAITKGAHLHMQLLPDYLVYDGERVLEWGYFDNEWNPQPTSCAQATD